MKSLLSLSLLILLINLINMKNKLAPFGSLAAILASCFASDRANSVSINSDDVGYVDFSFTGAYGFTKKS